MRIETQTSAATQHTATLSPGAPATDKGVRHQPPRSNASTPPGLEAGAARLIAGRGKLAEPPKSQIDTQIAQESNVASSTGPQSEASLGLFATIASWFSTLSAVGDFISNGGSRVKDALGSLYEGVRDAAIGFGRGVAEAVGSFEAGAKAIWNGDFVAGLGDFGLGMLKLLQAPVDASLMLGGKLISAAQTLVHLEAPGRELTQEELELASQIFGDSIDYSKVRIKPGDAGLLSPNERPFAHGNTVYLKNRQDMQTLVHELTHVWQHQHGGTDYMSEALLANATQGDDAYNWRVDVPAKAWHELNPEQQGALIESAYHDHAFEHSPPAFTSEWAAPAGVSLEELNQYLQAAVRELRAGRGAP